jgi:hypothetical protein
MTRTARIEAITQVAILLIMGVMAAASSLTHIHDLAVATASRPGSVGCSPSDRALRQPFCAFLTLAAVITCHKPPQSDYVRQLLSPDGQTFQSRCRRGSFICSP